VNREKEIFERALDLESSQERSAFLKGACGADVAMLDRLMGLLRASEGADGFLPETPQTGGALKLQLTPEAGDALGSRISHYKLLQKVGEGGSGPRGQGRTERHDRSVARDESGTARNRITQTGAGRRAFGSQSPNRATLR